MIETLENPPQDIIQERVKRDPAIGSPFTITFGTVLLP
jgi:hypothetical protein